MNTVAPPTPEQAAALRQLEAASQRLQIGRPEEARAILEQVLRVAPRSSDALHLYGVSLRRMGDVIGAELPVRQAISVDKRQPAYHVTLGDILQQLGWPDKAEASYRAALALNRLYPPAARQLALLLNDLGRPDEALKIITPLVAGLTADHGLLNAQAGALKGLGRLDEALAVYQRTVLVAPTSGVAEHNVAAVLGDLGRSQEAEAAARRAMAKGVDAAETRLVHARALLAIGQFDEAETAFQEALNRSPFYMDAHRDFAQLIWMRTEDKAQATARIDAGLRSNPDAVGLQQLKARVLTFAGDEAGADAVLREAVARHPDDVELRKSAAQAAMDVGDAERGLADARKAQSMSQPGDAHADTFVCEALLALGRADEAAAIAQDISSRFPQAQQRWPISPRPGE